ncbi:hypothetical protein DMTZ50_0314 [Dehalococcoides mccartyi]|uniref:hypothetical protein n=1 Tax=Dehalococcoides mccartyi TaxID=61435 RepID=UPI0005AAD7E8|nr:hypothetical protein [Dehalococcoides mccartyi]MBA2084509.1 hypothetical protein [Dehalococcoides mccartyi]
MRRLPGNIQRILTKDEEVLDQFNLKGSLGSPRQKVYCTNKRIIVSEHGAVLFGSHLFDADYNHISSIDLKTQPRIALLFIATLLILFSIPFWRNILGYTDGSYMILATMFTASGFIFVLIAFIFRTYRLEIFTTGRNKPIAIKSSRIDLEQILMFTRERRL